MAHNVKDNEATPDRLKLSLIKWAELLLLALLLLTGVLDGIRSVMHAAGTLGAERSPQETFVKRGNFL